MFTYDTIQNGDAAQVVITGFDGEVNFVNVPHVIDGMPVTAVSARAFADRKDVREVVLPETVTTLGGFAFHNCTTLRRLTLHNTVTNYSDGFIKGCRALTDVTMFVDAPKEKASFEAVKRLLADTDVVIRFRFVYDTEDGSLCINALHSKTVPSVVDGRDHPVALLTFPDYLNEAQEDTRARAIHQTIEGAGYAYRECVRRGEIDYAGYDALFIRVRSTAHVTAEEIAMNRLMAPYQLQEKARAQYADYLRERSQEVLLRLISADDAERIRFLASEHLIEEDAVDAVLTTAAGHPEIVAILMRV